MKYTTRVCLAMLACNSLFIVQSWASTGSKNVVVTPFLSPKGAVVSGYPTKTEISNAYRDWFDEFWKQVSYGKFTTKTQVMGYASVPWPIAPPAASVGDYPKTFTDGSSVANGCGEPFDETKDSPYGGAPLVDGVWTPGERFRDNNGDGKWTQMELWWDAASNENGGKQDEYDAYGEEFADWDKSGAFTTGTVLLKKIYIESLDDGTTGADAGFPPGDGIIGDPKAANPVFAFRNITVSELDLNTKDHFSTDLVFANNTDGDRAWRIFKKTDLKGSPTGGAVPKNGNFDVPLDGATGKAIFAQYGTVKYRTLNITGSGNSASVTIQENSANLYRAPEYFEDDDKDGKWTDREPFEDCLVRWDHTKGKNGEWVMVSDDYTINNYPGNGEDVGDSRRHPGVTMPAGAVNIEGLACFAKGTAHAGGTEGFAPYYDYAFLDNNKNGGYNAVGDMVVHMATMGAPVPMNASTFAYPFRPVWWSDVNHNAVFNAGVDDCWIDMDGSGTYSPGDVRLSNFTRTENLAILYSTVFSTPAAWVDCGTVANYPDPEDFVFLDANRNGVFDPGETVLSSTNTETLETTPSGSGNTISLSRVMWCDLNHNGVVDAADAIWADRLGPYDGIISSTETMDGVYTPGWDILLQAGSAPTGGPNGIDDNIDALLDRTGNGVYDGPEQFENAIDTKIQVTGVSTDESVSLLNWDPHHWFGSSVDTSFNIWWTSTFGSASPGVPTSLWKSQTFDVAQTRPFFFDGTIQVASISGLQTGKIYPDASGAYYDDAREFRDLPSSIYHAGGDLRFGEQTDPSSASISGRDRGDNNPSSLPMPDKTITMSGPMAYNVHGEFGYDAGCQTALELLTWRTDGRSLTDSIANRFVNDRKNGFAGCDFFTRRCRDNNLDGLVDQGCAPKAGFSNYTHDNNPNTQDDLGIGEGVFGDYPFNRTRLIEDMVALNDEALDFARIAGSSNTVDYLVPLYPSSIPGRFQGMSGLSVDVQTRDSSDPLTFGGQPGAIGATQGTTDFAISLVAHEAGHDWHGEPDLYDYDSYNGYEVNNPMGTYDLMAGEGGQNLTFTPITKKEAGWIQYRELKNLLAPGIPTKYRLSPVESNGDQYFSFGRGVQNDSGEQPPVWSSEKFILYYCNGLGSFTSPSGPGLYIIHQDDMQNSNGKPAQQRVGSHFTWELVQADGRNDMQDGLNTGDSGDPFPGSTGKNSFNSRSAPYSSWWDGQDSGLEIQNIALPSAGQPMEITLLWRSLDVPEFSFVQPPGGISSNGCYTIRYSAFDRYGTTTIYVYEDSATKGYSLTTSTRKTSFIKAGAGDTQGNSTLSLPGQDGTYRYWALLVPGADGSGLSQDASSHTYNSLTFGNGALAVSSVDINPNAADMTTNSSLQTWTIACVTAGGNGQAKFSVAGSVTGNEDAYLTCGTAFVTSKPCTGSIQFLVSAGSKNFGVGDTFLVRTTGLTPYSQPITIVNGEVSWLQSTAPGITLTVLDAQSSESGKAASIQARLNTAPTAAVNVTLTSSDLTEGRVESSGLVFTPANWNTAQTFSVKGVDDNILDGDQAYTVTAKLSSTDSNFDGQGATVELTNLDAGDVAGLAITPTTLATAETGTTASFTVCLRSQPATDVALTLNANDSTEGSFAPSALIFTAANWNQPQTVTVKGLNDYAVDGDVTWTISMVSTSNDSNYTGLTGTVSVTNTDDDTVGFVVSAPSNDTTEGGRKAWFTVALRSQPSGNVVLGLTSSNMGEATVSPATLTFTPDNWQGARRVFVQGVDDAIVDGTQSYTVTIAPKAGTLDNTYLALAPAIVSMVNRDDDGPGITLTPAWSSLRETNDEVAMLVSLDRAPTGTVTLAFAEAQGLVQITPATLTFTSANARGPQTVWLSGMNDTATTGNRTATIQARVTSSTDMAWTNFSAQKTIDLLDDESAGLLVRTASPWTGEDGSMANIALSLTKAPQTPVTVEVLLPDSTEGNLSTTTYTFNATNWATPQTVTVTGVDDNLADGDAWYALHFKLSSTDTAFDGLSVPDCILYNKDDETADLLVTHDSGWPAENGRTTTFSVRLSKAPIANVTIVLAADRAGEVTMDKSTLIFTAANYSLSQTVTVTGVDDAVADGSQPVNISFSISSTDAAYSGLAVPNLELRNTDDETVGVAVSDPSANTDENGAQATFTVALKSSPTATVTVSLAPSDTTEAKFSPATLTFTRDNWATAQTVTATGLDQRAANGNVRVYIMVSAMSSMDPDYNGLTGSSGKSFLNISNDITVAVTSPSGLAFDGTKLIYDATVQGGARAISFQALGGIGPYVFTLLDKPVPVTDATLNASTGEFGFGAASGAYELMVSDAMGSKLDFSVYYKAAPTITKFERLAQDRLRISIEDAAPTAGWYNVYAAPGAAGPWTLVTQQIRASAASSSKAITRAKAAIMTSAAYLDVTYAALDSGTVFKVMPATATGQVVVDESTAIPLAYTVQPVPAIATTPGSTTSPDTTTTPGSTINADAAVNSSSYAGPDSGGGGCFLGMPIGR